ncbi:transmembrane protein [Perilla frutescens var. frutescens]|nr:transmembrane protein [Perilla frutescens var. frutescens]
MVKVGCTSNGILDDSRFSEPMPWIGIYVVAASAACAIAMAVDAFHGFRYRKLWFPCKFFALNATTLTLIGVAVKLAVDLNTSMPRPQDQLAKLSSTAFICTAIGNSMPSLGTMENKELMMNVVALGILVVTVIVNICIQLGTGVIYVFWVEHAVVMFLMVVLFAILISSSFAIPATKYVLDIKYSKKYLVAMKECEANCNADITRKLRDDLARYWMMAHTCNPQFVVGRLATCTASGAFCLLSAVTLAEAILRSYLMPSCFEFCKGNSDYKWSTTLILATQAAAVVGGTIAPATRWSIAIIFRCPKRLQQRCSKNGGVSLVENYWVLKLYQLREMPLNLRICGRRSRKLVHNTKNKALDVCIFIQKATVVLSKIVGWISIIFVSQLKRILLYCMKLVSLVRCQNSIVNTDTDSESTGKLDLSHYVLHLEGEEELIDVMMQSDRDAIGHWIRMGRKKQPRELIKLLEKLNPSRGFEGIQTFDSHQVPSLDSVEPPNSWALPMVTLTSIAVATSNIEFLSVKEMMKSVDEGLKYVRVIENNLDTKKDLTNIRKAAEIVWVGVDLHYRWLDVDLRQLALQGKSPKDTIQELSDIAKNKFYELRKNDKIGCLMYNPSKWPVKVLAANAMYRICQTLLLTTENRSNECSKAMFNNLTAMTTDIMGACLTNLQYVISKKCHQSSIEQREENVRYAILLLGKSEKILEILSSCSSLSSNPEKVACINEWRTLGKENDQLFYESSTTSSSTPDLHLNID